MKEMELKIIDINTEEIISKLKNIGATLCKMEDQENYIYDFSDGSLLSQKGYARIRVINDKLNNKVVTYMTVKKMLSQEKFKVMDECETEISNTEEGKRIFSALGLDVVKLVKKYRKSYKYKNTLIEIDINDISVCPFPYLEIESNSEEEIIEVVSHLGYTMDDTTAETVTEILAKKGIKEHTIPKGL